jgi:chemotaxis protein CheZ
MTMTSDEMEALVRRCVRDETDALRQFVDRRIAELSMEISASVQLMDYSEANLSGQLARIHEQIAHVLAAPSEAARNSGVELEALVQATEDAANRIMEAAEAIDTFLQDGRDNPTMRTAVSAKISAIFEACSFQDLTSQRIRRAIEHLQSVETLLGNMIPDGTVPASGPAPVAPIGMVEVDRDNNVNPDMAQDAIDQLMAF